jgi:hypothetical protein
MALVGLVRLAGGARLLCRTGVLLPVKGHPRVRLPICPLVSFERQ